MIKGINHITISVQNLEESFSFYKDVLGFKPLVRHSRGAYFLAGDFWFCLDFDRQIPKVELPAYTHFAFTVDHNDFVNASEKVRSSGAKIWKENRSEGDSIYFLDPNGYQLELHVGNWQSRIESMKHTDGAEDVIWY